MEAGFDRGPVNAKGKPLKQPMFIHRVDGEPLAVAGLWTAWKDPEDPEQPLAAQRHDRHHRGQRDDVGGARPHAGDASAATAGRVARPRPTTTSSRSSDLFAARNDGVLTMHAVSTDVNNVRNNRAGSPRTDSESSVADAVGAVGTELERRDRLGPGIQVVAVDMRGGIGEGQFAIVVVGNTCTCVCGTS